MLLQRLVEYVDRLDDTLPAGYARNNVRYEIYLDSAGRLLSPKPLDLSSKENKAGQSRSIPSLRRPGTQPPPILLADHAEFTLGLPRPAKDATKAEDAEKTKGQAQTRHAAFMQLLERCAADTHDSAVTAVHAFLSASPLAQLDLGEDYAFTGTIEFVVDGQRVTERPAVRNFWADYNAKDGGQTMQCVVCHRQRPALDRLPGVIKGIPGGNATGTSLISANADAFESYGLKASQVAPICAECAEKFTNALNVLLASRNNRLGIQDLAYIFWTKEDVGFEFTGWFDTPDPEKVRELIDGARKGRFDKELDQTAYYALALTANNARAVVRDWLDTTVGQVKANLAQWFVRQAIVGGYGEEPAPLKLYALAAATVRDPKKELSSQTTAALLRSALTGTPLPDRLLQQAVRRCQVDRDVTRPRAALLKLVLLSNNSHYQEDAMIELQPDHPDAAYHCGRLLAVLETIQRRAADGQLNSTLVDRFYGTASSAPASVFGTLIRGAQPHITKLRKNKPGLAVRLEQEMEEVLSGIALFPATLTVKRQALFALGYYHQRAFDRAQAKEAGQQRQQKTRLTSCRSATAVLKILSTRTMQQFGLDQTFTRRDRLRGEPAAPRRPILAHRALHPDRRADQRGDSGGPLVNRCGEVIGITTAILPEAQNIGFAVPVDLIKDVVPSLLANGHVVRPWLGVQGQLVAQPLKDLLKVPLTDSFLVEVVEPGSPAEQAGLRGGRLDLVIGGQPILIGGDVISEIDGSPIDDPDKVAQALRSLKVGATVRLGVFRDGDTREVKVVLIERPLLPRTFRRAGPPHRAGRFRRPPPAARSAAPAGNSRSAPRKSGSEFGPKRPSYLAVELVPLGLIRASHSEARAEEQLAARRGMVRVAVRVGLGERDVVSVGGVADDEGHLAAAAARLPGVGEAEVDQPVPPRPGLVGRVDPRAALPLEAGADRPVESRPVRGVEIALMLRGVGKPGVGVRRLRQLVGRADHVRVLEMGLGVGELQREAPGGYQPRDVSSPYLRVAPGL